jgi:hypothetical protein
LAPSHSGSEDFLVAKRLQGIKEIGILAIIPGPPKPSNSSRIDRTCCRATFVA